MGRNNVFALSVLIASAAWLALMAGCDEGSTSAAGSTELASPKSTPAATPTSSQPPKAAPEATSPEPKPFTGSGPHLRANVMEHDFGEIWVGQELEYTYTLENAGNETLTIEEVKTTCGCTVAKPELMVLEPGQTTTMPVSFKPTSAGDQRKYVRIFSNSQPEGLVRLAIRGDVQPVVTCSPRLTEFGEVALGSTTTKTILVTSRDPEMVIESVEVRAKGFDARVLSSGPEGHQVEISLTGEAKWGEAYGSGSVLCRGELVPGQGTVEHKGRFIARASVFGQLRADKVVYSIRTKPGQSYSDVIRITRLTDEPFSLSAEISETNMPGVDVEVTPIASGPNGYDIKVFGTATQEYRGKKFSGKVHIETSVPGESLLGVRFAGIVNDPRS